MQRHTCLSHLGCGGRRRTTHVIYIHGGICERLLGIQAPSRKKRRRKQRRRGAPHITLLYAAETVSDAHIPIQ